LPEVSPNNHAELVALPVLQKEEDTMTAPLNVDVSQEVNVTGYIIIVTTILFCLAVVGVFALMVWINSLLGGWKL